MIYDEYENTPYAYCLFWMFFVGFWTWSLQTRTDPISLEFIIGTLEYDIFFSLFLYSIFCLQGGGMFRGRDHGDPTVYEGEMMPNMSFLRAILTTVICFLIFVWAYNVKHAPWWQMVLKYVIYLFALSFAGQLIGNLAKDTIKRKFGFLGWGFLGFLIAKFLLNLFGK